jgi:hypothetical protein
MSPQNWFCVLYHADRVAAGMTIDAFKNCSHAG